MFFWMYILILTDYLMNEDQTIRFHISWSPFFFSVYLKNTIKSFQIKGGLRLNKKT